ncbi:DUF1684 domain-containing protein [Sulfidibacter corallicola]|uniref:DUF1684 domain-containing protein n=1 Tax=Sulfidibacter corallicola TaxID=2818388 RepID=A0A8A4TV95_SULCO|nr:DUF1684 domain-containing protein [Sulfidibacter corallicola]QTD53876.1 DUF1684 domain-containing protein [Sulfidibacter corallicola]
MNILFCLFTFCFASQEQLSAFQQDEISWQKQREAQMTSDESWLSLVGLYWLKEGANTFGTDSANDFVLPIHSTVLKAGTFTLKDGKVTYRMERGQRAEVDGKLRNNGRLAMGEVLAHNHLRIFLIERGDRLALRIRDMRAKGLVQFKSLEFYAPKDKYRVEAVYEPFETPQKLIVGTVIDTEIELWVPGVLKFEIDGLPLEILPTLESKQDNQFFIMFKDQTAGATTYSGGRFLYTPLPTDGKLVINFNRAINPPCAYTAYATCPLPPAENWLGVPIEAGERTYRPSSHD